VAGWSSRGVKDAQAIVDQILALDIELRAAQTAGQEALAKRNAASKLIGAAMGKKDMAEADRLKAEVESLKGEIAAFERTEKDVGAKLRDILASQQNLAAEDVPGGEDESGNVDVDPAATKARFEAARPVLPAFKLNAPKDHSDLGEALKMLDFEAAARMSGARFAVLKGQLARLERAVGQFMLDLQTGEHGYLEVNPPYLVKDEAMFGTGQLPKFADDLFAAGEFKPIQPTSEQVVDLLAEIYGNRSMAEAMIGARSLASLGVDDPETRGELPIRMAKLEGLVRDLIKEGSLDNKRWLIPTAEVSLTNLVREQILDEAEIATPMRLTALTPCFRAEAGSAGRDTRGLIRQHQFTKVEMVSITRPEDSDAEHERMTGCAEAVLQKLELPYRRMLLCKGDMGFTARKTFDLEVWLPSQDTYREISSCSNCGDFQARRMDARFKRAGEKKTEFVHTLNGSGLAVGRTLVAIMENYQDEDGRIAVPAVLQPYMGGLTHVGA
jgi:seryl-tRNA synthetase